MKRLLIITLVTLAMMGCASKMVVTKTSAMLIEEGDELMLDGKYLVAAENYEKAVLNALGPEEARIAQKKLALAYFLNGNYLDAIAAFEIYLDIYTDDPDSALILYRLAVSYRNASLPANRDQSFTLSSVVSFERLKNLYYDKYLEYDAVKPHDEMLDKLAESEYKIGVYYKRIGAYKSSVTRFLYLVNHYPQSPRVESAYEQMFEAAMKDEELKSIAVYYLEELESKFPNNENIESYRKKLN